MEQRMEADRQRMVQRIKAEPQRVEDERQAEQQMFKWMQSLGERMTYAINAIPCSTSS